jgi:hypothetical protein
VPSAATPLMVARKRVGVGKAEPTMASPRSTTGAARVTTTPLETICNVTAGVDAPEVDVVEASPPTTEVDGEDVVVVGVRDPGVAVVVAPQPPKATAVHSAATPVAARLKYQGRSRHRCR